VDTTRVVIPAREARAVQIAAGHRFRVVDLEGGQVVDLFAFSSKDVNEYASAEHTRVHVKRLFPKVGEHFVTNKRRPILLFLEDQSPGVHDMLYAACDPTRYSTLGVQGWHASCQENLLTAMMELGYPSVEVPQPINVFMDIPVAPDGELGSNPARTGPGDYVKLQAEMDAVIVASACPQDISNVNNNAPSSVAIEVVPE
jgi:uncharacterized protein